MMIVSTHIYITYHIHAYIIFILAAMHTLIITHITAYTMLTYASIHTIHPPPLGGLFSPVAAAYPIEALHNF